MTDEERWRTEERPSAVIYHVGRNHRKAFNSRKNRLFACGCYRLIWKQITLPEIHHLVELAEARADREAKQSELDNKRYVGAVPGLSSTDNTLRLYITSLLGSKVIPDYIALITRSAAEPNKYSPNTHWQACPEQAELARCVYGNPFRPVAFDPAWRSESAVALARAAYEARNFTLLPILADALEEAGCDHPDVLAHCRQPDATHVRGCWVVDLVLGKS